MSGGRAGAWLAAVTLTLLAGASLLRPGPLPRLGPLLDPVRGIWSVAREAELPARATDAIPGLTAPVLRQLLAALPPTDPGAVAVPESGGHRGHPIVLPAGLVPRVLTWDPARRLSDLLREPDVAVRGLSGFGPGILRDVDVPADLATATG